MKSQTPIISAKSLSIQTDYVVEVWNSDNGLPQNTVVNILQTHDGFIWIATANGICRFDGNKFRTYTNSNTSGGLPGNNIDHLFEDSRNVLWVITKEGKLVYLYKNTFKTIKHDNTITVKTICENSKGELIVGTLTNELYLLQHDQFKTYIKLPAEIPKLTKIDCIGNELYITTNQGVYRQRGNEVKKIEEINGDILVTRKGPNKSLWVYTSYNQLYKVQTKSCEPVDLPKTIIKQGYLRDFYVDDDEKIWFANKAGLILLDHEKISIYNTTTGLASNNLSVIYKDMENNIWVGTIDAGVHMLKMKTFKTYSKEDGLFADPVGTIIQGEDSSVLIANFCEGVSRLYKNNVVSFNNTHNGCLWVSVKNKKNNFLISTYDEGIYQYKDGVYLQLTTNSQKPFTEAIFGLFQDKSGLIWIGTDKGLYTYKDKTFTAFEANKIKGKIANITQASDGKIWFCSDNGLGEIENGKTRLFSTSDGLSHNSVRDIYEDEDGTFWIATYGGGINRFKDGIFFAFNQPTNLMDENTSSIFEDDTKNIWISSNHGIYCAKRSDLNNYADGKSPFLNLLHYGKEDGLKNSECNGGFQSPGLKIANEQLWFPTMGGAALVNLKNIPKTNYTPELFIESVVVDDKELTDHDSIFTLSRQTKTIAFNYTAPFFTKSENILFQYKLEGLDIEWSNPTNTRVAVYTELPPGEYVFKIRIYGSTNTNVNKERSVPFHIPHPFWRTITFYTLITILLIGIMLMLVLLRIRNIRKKEQEKTEINKNYAALELKALQGQMNPHFIFNCLNTIKYFIASDDKASANKYLGKFSKLIRMVLEYSTSNYIKLTDEIELLRLYIELEQLRFDDGFEVNMNISSSLEIGNIEIPTMLLQPFVENAIHHGLWPNEKTGILNLSFEMKDDKLIVHIDDNGIGRTRSMEMKKNQHHISMGMNITEERVKTFNYIENSNIELEYTDKVNTNNEPTGTLVTIRIPLTRINN